MRTTHLSSTTVKPTGSLPQRQDGATLIIALVMLLLISLLAIGGMQGSILQERMASNAHDGAISFQAAEAALRQAEADLMGSPAVRLTAETVALLPTPSDWDGANPAPAGTGNAGADVSAQPVYHHAYLASFSGSSTETGAGAGPFYSRFEVTSRGQGGTAEAVTVLRSTVVSPQ
jgi:type IV pilus assembly protein PilX